jgi:hypothetical protein
LAAPVEASSSSIKALCTSSSESISSEHDRHHGAEA